MKLLAQVLIRVNDGTYISISQTVLYAGVCSYLQHWPLRVVFSSFRDASWELEPNAYDSLLNTNLECEADECICPQGRREDKVGR